MWVYLTRYSYVATTACSKHSTVWIVLLAFKIICLKRWLRTCYCNESSLEINAIAIYISIDGVVKVYTS